MLNYLLIGKKQSPCNLASENVYYLKKKPKRNNVFSKFLGLKKYYENLFISLGGEYEFLFL